MRPVPAYARVRGETLHAVEDELADDEDRCALSMDAAFSRFEASQPELCLRVQESFERPLDETALSLGYFLSIAIWIAFERDFGARLGEVTRDVWLATRDALDLEEHLRLAGSGKRVDETLDDVLANGQPDVLSFLREHMDAALETAQLCLEGLGGPGAGAIDAEDIRVVYRLIVLEVLALSHCVAAGPNQASPELCA